MIININKKEENIIKTLDKLEPGEIGVVAKIHGNSPIKRRIVDMGIVAETCIKVVKLAPLGDPMEIKVKNFNLSLRKSEAALIELKG